MELNCKNVAMISFYMQASIFSNMHISMNMLKIPYPSKRITFSSDVGEGKSLLLLDSISPTRVLNNCTSHWEAAEERRRRAGVQLPEWSIQKFNNSQRRAESTTATTIIGNTSISQFSENSRPERRHNKADFHKLSASFTLCNII